jgi:hypothetical protein
MSDGARISRGWISSKSGLFATTALITAFGAAAFAQTVVNPGETRDNSGVLNDDLQNNGVFNNLAPGGVVNAPSFINNAQALNNNGVLNAPITNNTGGVLNNNNEINSDINATGGQVRNNNGGVINGDITNNGATVRTAVGSNINGAVTNNGAVVNRGTIDTTGSTGVLDNNGSYQNFGQTTTTSLDTSGTLANEAGGTIDTDTAVLSGTVNNEGEINSGTSVTQTGGSATNSGTLNTPILTINGGSFGNDGGTVSGNLVVNSGGTFGNGTTGSVGGTITNNAGGTFNSNGNVYSTTVTNAGTLNSRSDLFSTLNNTGTMNVDGNTQVTGPATGGATALFSLDSPTQDVTDRLRFDNGLASNGSTYAVDLDLSGPVGMSDQVIVTGATTGAINLQFDPGSPAYRLQSANNGLTHVFDMGDGSAVASSDLSSMGLPTGGLVSYGLVRTDGASTITGTGDFLSVRSSVSPSVNALASGLSLTQDTITSVVNRPSSPFVSGLISGQECSQGGWVRAIAGEATLSDTRTNSPSTVDTEYHGVLLGFDSGCFDGRFGGWDLVLGGAIGYNSGDSDQTMFATSTDVNTGAVVFNPNQPISDVTADFEQYSGSLYIAGRKGSFTGDVQLRYDETETDLTETLRSPAQLTAVGVNPAAVVPLGLSNTGYTSDTFTISGRVNYNVALGMPGLSVTPTAGFSLSETRSTPISFTTGETLDIDTYYTSLGFVGATLAKTIIDASGTGGTTLFVGGNYYNDFSDDRDVTFRDTVGTSSTVTTGNLGDFGEVNVGVNRVATMGKGSAAVAQQLNASLRVDARFGDAIDDAYALTAQLRFSF